MSARRFIELHAFKWPRRQTVAPVPLQVLGEDDFGLWLGVRQGATWSMADGSRSGVFEQSLVKLIPPGTYWTACFHPIDPVIDVDIVLPVQRMGDRLEEVDLELDVLRLADGSVHVRDRDEFERRQREWQMPKDIVNEAESTCQYLKALLERHEEPFGEVGLSRLTHFLDETGAFGHTR